MSSLTMHKRFAIAQILCDRAFKQKIEQAEAEAALCATRLVERDWGHYLSDVQKVHSLIRGANRQEIYLYRETVYADLPGPRTHSYSEKDLEKRDASLVKPLFSAMQAFSELKAQRRKLNQDLEGLLKPIRTYKQLYVAWPELEELKEMIGDNEAKAEKSKALVLQTKELNKLVGLPTPKVKKGKSK